MTYEDFTTYTEVDEEADLAVIVNKITVDTMDIDVTTYVKDDKGAGYFGNFEHLIDAKAINFTTGSLAGFWAISDTVYTLHSSRTANEGLWAYLYRIAAGTYRIYIEDSTNDNADSGDITVNTNYYTTIKRDGTTLTCKIYSNSARTVLVDTLTLVCTNATYKTIIACFAFDFISGGESADAEIEKLDLQEVEPHTPSDTAKSSDALIFDAKVPIADTAKASDALTFKAEIPIGDTAKASDSISFFKGIRFEIGDTAKASDDLTFAAEINIEDTAKASDIFASDTPSEIPCVCPTFTLNGTSTPILFPKPEWANPNNEISKDVSLFNFWSGDIDTVDKGINTQTLTIGGTVCICGGGVWRNVDTMTTWLDSIKTASNNGEEFTINELGNCLNGVYVIRNFIFDTLKGTADCFTWSLNLERIRDI